MSQDGLHPRITFDTRGLSDGVLLKACGRGGRLSALPVRRFTGRCLRPGRCPTAGWEGGPRDRRRASGRTPHPHRSQLWGRPPAATRRQLPPSGQRCPHGRALVCGGPPRGFRRDPRPGPSVLGATTRGSGALQLGNLRAVAVHHHLRPSGPGFAGGHERPGGGSSTAAVVCEGGRAPEARLGPPPRPGPSRHP